MPDPGSASVASGLIAPFVLQAFGPGSWWIVWWAMTLLAVAMTIPLLLAPIDAEAGVVTEGSAKFALTPVMIYLVGYFLFGAGYIAYMTFMIAYVRDAGGGAAAQSAFWCLIGLSAFATPWLWRRVLARRQRRHLHRDHSRHQRTRRSAAAVRAFGGIARDIGAGIRRRILRGGRIDHRLRAL